jgi:nucleotide-binding universal stress UspA family protein
MAAMLSGMKLLIGHDGSECSDGAVADLRRAGLPPKVDALVVTVAEVWPAMPASAFEPLDPQVAAGASPAVRKAHALCARALADASETADAAAARVRSLFPQWTVRAETAGDSPTQGLVRKLEQWEPDLMVVGSRGRSGVGRMLLGSVSQAVISHAACSVRVGRCAAGAVPPEGAPVKVAVAVDGSVDAAAAVSAVASRAWPAGSTALVLTAVDLPLSMALLGLGAPIGTLPNEPDLDGHARARLAAEAVERELTDAGLTAISIVREGDPKRMIVEEAQQWGADCIFVGAQGHGRVEKLLLGSVSSAVAARAHCSVEIVRQG